MTPVNKKKNQRVLHSTIRNAFGWNKTGQENETKKPRETGKQKNNKNEKFSTIAK